MQATQSVPSQSSRPTDAVRAGEPRAPQAAPRPSSAPVPAPQRSEPAELERVVDLGYN